MEVVHLGTSMLVPRFAGTSFAGILNTYMITTKVVKNV